MTASPSLPLCPIVSPAPPTPSTALLTHHPEAVPGALVEHSPPLGCLDRDWSAFQSQAAHRLVKERRQAQEAVS